MLFFRKTSFYLCKKKFRSFGEGSLVRPGSYIVNTRFIDVGKNVVIRPGSYICADESIDAGHIMIEDNVLLAPGISIFTNDHSYSADPTVPICLQGYPENSISNGVTLKEGCWICANSLILKGVTVGQNSVVGVGSLVNSNVPSRSIYAGIPAKLIRKITYIKS